MHVEKNGITCAVEVAKREEDRVENPVVVIKAENPAVNVENQGKKEKEELAVEEDDNLG